MRATIVTGVVVSVAACGSTPRAPQPVANRAVAAGAAIEAPVLPLLADELAPGFERRARLARFDAVWLDDRAPVAGRRDSAGLDDTEYVVVAEDGDRVRLRVDDEWVRVLVWVERDQLQPALVRDTDASGHVRPIARGAGLRLRAGAPIAIEPGHRGARVTVEDEHLTAFATIPGDALGDVWRADDARPDADDVAARPRPPGSIAKRGELLDAPATGAQILARVDRTLAVTTEHPSPVPGWHLVTVDTPYLSVTGYVVDASWIPGGRLVITDTELLPVESDGVRLAAGTCLYARPDGPLVGVVLVEQQDARRTRRGWARWEWATWWGRVRLYARPIGGGFESCPVAATGGPGL